MDGPAEEIKQALRNRSRSLPHGFPDRFQLGREGQCPNLGRVGMAGTQADIGELAQTEGNRLLRIAADSRQRKRNHPSSDLCGHIGRDTCLELREP